MARFSIGMQIGIGFAIAIALMLVSALLNFSQLQVMVAKSDDVARLSTLDAGIHSYLEALVDEETGMRAYVASKEPAFLDPFKAGRTAEPLIFGELKAQSADSAAVGRSVTTAGQDAKRVGDFFDREIADAQAGRQLDAVARLGDGKTAFDAFRADLAAARSEVERQKAGALSDFSAAQHGQVVSTMVTAIASIAILIGLAIFLGRSIVGRLERVTCGLHSIVDNEFARLMVAYDELEQGNLSAEFSANVQPIDERGTDEISRLAKSYNAFSRGLSEGGAKFTHTAHHLRSTMREIAAASAELTAAGSVVSAATEQSKAGVDAIIQVLDSVAEGAARQAEGVASTSSATEELARTTAQITTGAVDQAGSVKAVEVAVGRLDEQLARFSELAQSLKKAGMLARTETSGGTDAVDATSGAMTRLRDEVANTALAVSKLEAKSGAVEDIVSTIDEIADQTNLLALNAAIEAARAGEAGRGFAIVADEVRKLAERSTLSTRQINGILSEIHTETKLTNIAVRSAVTSIESTLTLAGKASQALLNARSAVGDASQLANELRKAADEMRAASIEVREHITSVSAVVEENAAASQQMQSTTQMVTAAMLPISELATQQSSSASEASSSALALGKQAQDIASSAATVCRLGERLCEVLSGFSLDDDVCGSRADPINLLDVQSVGGPRVLLGTNR